MNRCWWLFSYNMVTIIQNSKPAWKPPLPVAVETPTGLE